jgi:hypothetical protein
MIRCQLSHNFTVYIPQKLPDLTQHMGIDTECAIGYMINRCNAHIFLQERIIAEILVSLISHRIRSQILISHRIRSQ